MQLRPELRGADAKPKSNVFPACPSMPVRANVPEFRKSTGIVQTSNFSRSSTAVIFIGTGSYLFQQLIIFQNITANRTRMSESEKCFTSSESSDQSAETLANGLLQMAPLVGPGPVPRALIPLPAQPAPHSHHWENPTSTSKFW